MDKFDISKIDLKWVLISLGIFLVCTIVIWVVFSILAVLTLGLGFFLAFLVPAVIFFLGGFITGYLSPGETIYEPAIGALVFSIVQGFLSKQNFFFLMIGVVIAFFCAMVGAQFGEKAQANKG